MTGIEWKAEEASLMVGFTFLCLFIYWLCFVFIATQAFSLIVASKNYCSLVAGLQLSLLWLPLRSTGSRHAGFSICGSRAQELWCMGLAAPRHVGSSRIRDWTHVSCIGRQIIYHWANQGSPRLYTLTTRRNNGVLSLCQTWQVSSLGHPPPCLLPSTHPCSYPKWDSVCRDDKHFSKSTDDAKITQYVCFTYEVLFIPCKHPLRFLSSPWWHMSNKTSARGKWLCQGHVSLKRL